MAGRGGRYFISQNPWVIPAITRIHRWFYQLFGGRFVASAGTSEILLLTTLGRHSGEKRVTPLLYVVEPRSFVIVASNGGQEKPPGWWFNLQAEPKAHVQCGTEHFDVVGREANEAELEALWPKLMASYEFFDDYQDRTDRKIPVVILDRA
jgi:deazaflavin-dependent oxidoreductase (nitroreductase family)